MTNTRNRITAGDGDPRHGTANGYGNHRCRCDLCRAAHRVRHAAYMAASVEQRRKHVARQVARRRRAASS